MTVKEVLDNITEEDIRLAMTTYLTDRYDRELGKYVMKYENREYPVKNLVQRAASDDLSTASNLQSFNSVLAKKRLEELGFNDFKVEEVNPLGYYLKKVLNQDVERTFSVSNKAANDFFNLQLDHGQEKDILLNYIDNNSSVETRFNKRKTRNEHRFFPEYREIINEDDILLFTKSGDDYSMEVIYSNDERFEDLSHLLDGANHLLTDHLTGNHNNSTKTNAMSEQPLNQILYGPPGTGKTYSTITKALDIIGVDYKDYEEAQDLFQHELVHPG